VPILWRPVFEPVARLFLYVLYRSHWGQRGVALTSAFIAEIGLSRWAASRALARLERKKVVRVDRRPGQAVVAWPKVLSA
jgi:hypothetical protein